MAAVAGEVTIAEDVITIKASKMSWCPGGNQTHDGCCKTIGFQQLYSGYNAET